MLLPLQLERAIRAYVNGVWRAPSDFSDKYCGEQLISYTGSCSKLSGRRWKEILDACDVSISESDADDLADERADLSLLDKRRGMLFDLSSPIKVV